ncbi:MAG: hypothetical protein HY077_15245 [Elusimicrobia bacterium]|nr:hypothetical protein [Elusimicrobiota bacterium]
MRTQSPAPAAHQPAKRAEGGALGLRLFLPCCRGCRWGRHLPKGSRLCRYWPWPAMVIR